MKVTVKEDSIMTKIPNGYILKNSKGSITMEYVLKDSKKKTLKRLVSRIFGEVKKKLKR